MISHRSKIYIAVTVICVAVILLGVGIFSFLSQNNRPVVDNHVPEEDKREIIRNALTGEVIEEIKDFFTIAIMFDNAYDARPQYGLDQAAVVYEALAEGNITRLMGIFDSTKSIEKIGPVRSARPYFMDWAEEYSGIYMHVGGSPDALSIIDSYNFQEIDQIGAGEIYFWRDNNLEAPHNVFTSSANWLRVGEIKEINNFFVDNNWTFVDSYKNEGVNISIDYHGPYKVDWQYNDKLQAYLRFQGDDKFIYNTGEQAQAANVIVQVASSKIVDDKERRVIKTQEGGKAYVFNKLGSQEGTWEVVSGRTLWFDDNKNPLQLVAGQTWVEVIPDEEYLVKE